VKDNECICALKTQIKKANGCNDEINKNGFVFKYMLVSACVVVVVQVGYQIPIFVAKGHYTLCTVWEIVLVSFFIFIFQLCIKIFY
jgi:hypothetical protein